MPDDGTDVEGDGAHVEEHTRDVYQRGEEEDSLAPEESRQDDPRYAVRERGPAGGLDGGGETSGGF